MTDRLTDRLLLWLPAGLGGLVALLVLGLGAAPLVSQLQLEGRQLEQKQALEQRLPQIRVELSRLVGAQQQAERQQQQVLTLIAGSGELVTFLAQVDRLAQRHRVQLQLFEPTADQPAAATEGADPLKAQAKGTRAAAAEPAAGARAAGPPAEGRVVQHPAAAERPRHISGSAGLSAICRKPEPSGGAEQPQPQPGAARQTQHQPHAGQHAAWHGIGGAQAGPGAVPPHRAPLSPGSNPPPPIRSARSIDSQA